MNNLVEIGRFGKSVGLKGEIKIHLSTDFPESLIENINIYTSKERYTLQYFNENRSLLKLKEINGIDQAKALTNELVYMSKEDTLKNCELESGEYFWFDLDGVLVYEHELLLGTIDQIDRLGNSDYIMIKTDPKLVNKNYPKSFLLPYTDRYIIEFDKENKKLFVQYALEILASS